MKVAIIAFNGIYPFMSHGPAITLYALVKGLEELGLEAYIFTRNTGSNFPRNFLSHNVKIVDITRIKHFNEPYSICYALSFLKNAFSTREGSINATLLFKHYLNTLDIVYYNMPPIDPFTVSFPMLADRYRKKQVYYLQGSLINERKNSPLRYMFKFLVKMGYFDTIIVPTERARKQAERLIAARNVVVIPNCIYTPIYEKHMETTLKLDGEINLLSVSRLVPIKRVDVTIKAFSKVVEINPKAHLYIAGDGPLMRALVMMVRKLGVEGNVHFLGHIKHDKLIDLYLASDIFVLSSDDENMSVSSLEAMASKCAVVLTEPAATDLIEDGINGLVFKPGDWRSLYEKLITLIDNPKMMKQLGEKAYETIRKRYDYRVVALRTKRLFEELLYAGH
jgi:glycosyltransferase involved in cell wall biosynthesis